MDGLDQHTLVLENITFAFHVQRVVQMLVDLLGVTVLLEKTTQHTQTTHPNHSSGHAGILATNAFPCAVWRPLRLAAKCLRTLYREWIFVGFLITRPSLASLRILRREFAMEISLTSFGSNQIFLFPHFNTDA